MKWKYLFRHPTNNCFSSSFCCWLAGAIQLTSSHTSVFWIAYFQVQSTTGNSSCTSSVWERERKKTRRWRWNWNFLLSDIFVGQFFHSLLHSTPPGRQLFSLLLELFPLNYCPVSYSARGLHLLLGWLVGLLAAEYWMDGGGCQVEFHKKEICL